MELLRFDIGILASRSEPTMAWNWVAMEVLPRARVAARTDGSSYYIKEDEGACDLKHHSLNQAHLVSSLQTLHQTSSYHNKGHSPTFATMKFSSALTFLGLAVVTLASPLESAHDSK